MKITKSKTSRVVESTTIEVTDVAEIYDFSIMIEDLPASGGRIAIKYDTRTYAYTWDHLPLGNTMSECLQAAGADYLITRIFGNVQLPTALVNYQTALHIIDIMKGALADEKNA